MTDHDFDALRTAVLNQLNLRRVGAERLN